MLVGAIITEPKRFIVHVFTLEEQILRLNLTESTLDHQNVHKNCVILLTNVMISILREVKNAV